MTTIIVGDGNKKRIVIKTTESECSIAHPDGTKVCSKPKIIQKIAEISGATNSDATAILTEVKEKLNCDTEKCVLKKIIKKVEPDVAQEIKESLATDFKPNGPALTTALLSNIDIDKILAQMAAKYDLLAMPFHMIDFDTFRGGNTDLNTIDLADEVAKGMKTFSVVLNTDKYSGNGVHWFCLFGDFRGKGTQDDPYTLEYFNSSGDRPRASVAEWLVKQEASINKKMPDKTVVVRKDMPIAHQQGDTECGVYALYYLIERIKGKSRDEINSAEIPDDEMTKFRQALFV